MQLLLRKIRNKIIAPCILCHKFIFVILLLLHVHVSSVTAERTCHQCRGINCLRTTYETTQKCLNDLDICVTVFDGQTILAQGCLEQLSEELRHKCGGMTQTEDSKELSECFKCNENLCNNLASSSFKCIQCDSDDDENCRTNPISLLPSICGISRTPDEYCYVKREGNRVIRGCSQTLEEQKSCLASTNCMICQPSELTNCNAEEHDNDGSDSGDNGSDSNSDGGNSGDNGSQRGRTCHQCSGINCLRTTYESIQECSNDLDICVNVYDGQTILAQGCLEQLSEDLRQKCEAENLTDCFKCNENLCNNLASSSFECVQCDSDMDENCRTNPQSLVASRCDISRTPNEYCFVKQEGQKVIRGCAKTLEEQTLCLASTDCMICQPSQLSECNGEQAIDDSGSGSSGDGGSGSGDDGGSDGGNTGDGGSGDGSDGGNTGDGGSDGGNTGNGGSDNSGGSEDGNSGSGSDGGNTGDGGSGSGGGSDNGGGTGDGGSDNGSGDGGNGSGGGGSGDKPDGNGSNLINSHIFIFILNVVIVFYLSI